MKMLPGIESVNIERGNMKTAKNKNKREKKHTVSLARLYRSLTE
jgi:hypothetical protein